MSVAAQWHAAGCELHVYGALGSVREQEHVCGLHGFGAWDTCPACEGPRTYRAAQCTCGLDAEVQRALENASGADQEPAGTTTDGRGTSASATAAATSHGVPCARCEHLQPDASAPYGVRCARGQTSDQAGDFSCFRRRPAALDLPDEWPPAWTCNEAGPPGR